MTRQENLSLLSKLRQNGWETYILPYGISFNETLATDAQLQSHVQKILKRRHEIISQRISSALKAFAIVLILTLVILNAIFKKG